MTTRHDSNTLASTPISSGKYKMSAKELVAILAEAYRENITQIRLRLYQDLLESNLKDADYYALAKAILLDSSIRSMPTIAHIVKTGREMFQEEEWYE